MSLAGAICRPRRGSIGARRRTARPPPAPQWIGKELGGRYLPPEPRVYRSPAKNAQEAHEAIRPTDLARRPGDVAPHLETDMTRLYEVIWKRTTATQMASALLDQVSIDIAEP